MGHGGGLRNPALLVKEVGAIAGHPLETVGEIEIPVGQVLLPLLVGRDLLEQPEELVVAEHRPAGDRLEQAMAADARLEPRRQVEVGKAIGM